MKKYVDDMNTDEIRTLVEQNDTIYQRLQDRALDNAQYDVDMYLQGFPGDYEIGGQYDYLTILEDTYTMTYDNFEEWFNGVQRNYCLISDTEEETVRLFLHYAAIWHKLEYEVVAKQADYEYITQKMNELKDDAERIILDRLEAEYSACYDTDCLVELIDDMDDFDGAFIIDDDYSTIYRHEPGVYIPAHDEIIA